ncbi:MAG: SPOR domain-containing protein [Paracoccaceae bacterium]
MFGKVLSVAILAAVFGATSVYARGLGGPAEQPPAGYKGQQYVDSNGCVFLRAGYGGQVTWVPRVSRDRKQLCGYPSSGGKIEVATAAESAPQPEPVAPKVAVTPEAPLAMRTATGPKTVTAPVAKVAPSVTRPATPSELAATETRGSVVVAPQGGSGYQLACPASTPVAERFDMRGGGTKVMCTTGNGNLDDANFPILVAGSTAGHLTGFDAHMAAGQTDATDGGAVYAGSTSKSTKSAKYPETKPPAGYKLAWKDDRLNPNRGKQTVAGFQDMDDIWTRTSPAELREDSDIKRRPVTIIVRHRDGTRTSQDGYVLSTKGGGETVVRADGTPITKATKKVSKSTKAVAPEVSVAKPAAKAKAQPQGSGHYLVQVGTFGVISNAEGAAGRLKGQGMPVARAKLKGGALTVVYAGPFASAADAKAALSAARGMGFSDARIVQ